MPIPPFSSPVIPVPVPINKGGSGTIFGSPAIANPAYNVSATSFAHWYQALRAALNGTAPAKVVLYGDSITYGYTGVEVAGYSDQANVSIKATPARLATLFSRALGTAGSGINFLFTDSTYTDNRLVNSGATVVNLGPFGKCGLNVSGAGQSFTFTPTVSGDTFTLYYLTGPSYGTFKAQTTVQSQVTINANAVANGYSSYTFAANPTYGADTITITGVAANNATIMAIEFAAGITTGTTGVKVSSCALFGQKAGDLVGTPADLQGSLAIGMDMVAPDLSIINFAANEYSAQTPVATFKTNYQTLITRAKQTGDVLLVATVPQNASLGIPLSSYTTALYELAVSNNVPLIDLQKRWVDYATSSALNLYNDSQHPNYLGYYDVALADFVSITASAGILYPLKNVAEPNLNIGEASAKNLSFGSAATSTLGDKIATYGAIKGSAFWGVTQASSSIQIHSDTSSGNIEFGYGSAASFTQSAIFTGTGDLGITRNLVGNTSAGNKIGTATNQKFGFYNSTPIAQPTGNILTALSSLGLVGSPTLATTDISPSTGTGNNVLSASPVFSGTPSMGSVANADKLYLYGTTYGLGIDGSDTVVFANTGTGISFKDTAYNGTTVLRIRVGSTKSIDLGTNLNMNGANNIILDTTTGTKIGTATNQKLAFYNSTPIVQEANTIDLGTVLSDLGLRAAGTAYPITTTGAVSTGNLTLGTAGNKISITTGSNASAGTGTLVGGTVTISTTAVTANSLIFLTDTASSLTNVGILSVTAKIAGTSFTVTSSVAIDTSTFNWLIIN